MCCAPLPIDIARRDSPLFPLATLRLPSHPIVARVRSPGPVPPPPGGPQPRVPALPPHFHPRPASTPNTLPPPPRLQPRPRPASTPPPCAAACRPRVDALPHAWSWKFCNCPGGGSRACVLTGPSWHCWGGARARALGWGGSPPPGEEWGGLKLMTACGCDSDNDQVDSTTGQAPAAGVRLPISPPASCPPRGRCRPITEQEAFPSLENRTLPCPLLPSPLNDRRTPCSCSPPSHLVPQPPPATPRLQRFAQHGGAAAAAGGRG